MNIERAKRGVFVNNIIIFRQDTLNQYMYCPVCKKPVYKTSVPGFFSQCIGCGKQYYLSETIYESDENEILESPVAIALNSENWLLNENGNRILFRNVEEAQQYLLSHNVDESSLNVYYYIDSAMQEEIDAFFERQKQSEE